MKIVLLERVSKLGQMGDIVDVKSGYARNFLLPNKIGLRATEANIQIFEGRKAELETKNLESKASAEKVKAKLEGKYFILLRSASDAGALYGSVSSKDICTAAANEEVKILKNQVVLEKPIKELGVHNINISLHPEVFAEIFINVARTIEEAKLQATGMIIKDKGIEDQSPKLQVESIFEDKELSANIEDDGNSASKSLLEIPENSSGNVEKDKQDKNQG